MRRRRSKWKTGVCLFKWLQILLVSWWYAWCDCKKKGKW